MLPSVEDDWSDSDEEVLSEVETSVLLGVPDGSISTPADLTDAAVSRIGGHAVRYVPHVPSSSVFNSCILLSTRPFSPPVNLHFRPPNVMYAPIPWSC